MRAFKKRNMFSISKFLKSKKTLWEIANHMDYCLMDTRQSNEIFRTVIFHKKLSAH